MTEPRIKMTLFSGYTPSADLNYDIDKLIKTAKIQELERAAKARRRGAVAAAAAMSLPPARISRSRPYALITTLTSLSGTTITFCT